MERRMAKVSVRRTFRFIRGPDRDVETPGEAPSSSTIEGATEKFRTSRFPEPAAANKPLYIFRF
jgi:hypothetical protein